MQALSADVLGFNDLVLNHRRCMCILGKYCFVVYVNLILRISALGERVLTLEKTVSEYDCYYLFF